MQGWAYDITTRAQRHYYKDGKSLFGKAFEKKFFKHFDKDFPGSKYAKDCVLCIKKLQELKK